MDILYFYKHADNDDLRYSLRSVAKYAPYIRKVWIYGDRPDWISGEVEHAQNPGHVNFFKMLYWSSKIPELSDEYLRMSDDFFLLKDYLLEEACKVRWLEDLSKFPRQARGFNPWQVQLWNTHDTLRRLGYEGLNYETHTPCYLKKEWVQDAYNEFEDFVTKDKFYGILGTTSILNHAQKKHQFPLVNVHRENSRAGFWQQKPSYDRVVLETMGKTFLNFNEDAYGDGIKRFLEDKFPEKCKYEAI